MNTPPLVQHGIALITALVFLVILTLIGITAFNSTSLVEKMNQNLRDATTAFTAADTAVSDGEAWLKAQTTVPTAVTSCTTPPCHVWAQGVLSNLTQQPTSWWQTQGWPFSSSLLAVATQPYYIIEQYSFVPYELSPDVTSKGRGYYYYRITARGTGLTTNALANVQSIYGIQFG